MINTTTCTNEGDLFCHIEISEMFNFGILIQEYKNLMLLVMPSIWNVFD